MKVTKPTAVQSQAIPLALGGADFIAVAQTGSGKTLAFAVPMMTALLKKETARALVLAPSREMAQQLHRVLSELCVGTPITCSLVIGGLPGAKQSSQLRKTPRIIVATPGRMNDHLATNKLLLQKVEMVVIDEADRMLDLGFAPQLKNIHATLRGPRQTLMFSATFDSAVESVAKMFMRDDAVMIRGPQAEGPVSTLRQKVLLIARDQKNDRLLDELNAVKGGVIVFTADKERCESLGKYLKEYGYATDFVHGELSAGHRNRVIRELRNGEIRVVVATDLLARGIDVPHVDLIVNFDFPFDAGDFIHRIGRTARAGRVGYAVTFVTSSDERRYEKAKPYLVGAEIEKVDYNFTFAKGRNDRYADKSKFAPKPSLRTEAAREGRELAPLSKRKLTSTAGRAESGAPNITRAGGTDRTFGPARPVGSPRAPAARTSGSSRVITTGAARGPKTSSGAGGPSRPSAPRSFGGRAPGAKFNASKAGRITKRG